MRSLSIVCVSFLLTVAIGVGEARALTDLESPKPEEATAMNHPEDGEVWERWDGVGSQIGWGLGVGLLAAIPGVAIGSKVFSYECDPQQDFCGATAAFSGGATLMSLAIPAVVYVVGSAQGGDGSFWMTMLGAIPGVMIAVIPGLTNSGGGALLLGPPVAMVGSLIGYHNSASATVPIINVAATDGGGLLTMGGRF